MLVHDREIDLHGAAAPLADAGDDRRGVARDRGVRHVLVPDAVAREEVCGAAEGAASPGRAAAPDADAAVARLRGDSAPVAARAAPRAAATGGAASGAAPATPGAASAAARAGPAGAAPGAACTGARIRFRIRCYRRRCRCCCSCRSTSRTQERRRLRSPARQRPRSRFDWSSCRTSVTWSARCVERNG